MAIAMVTNLLDIVGRFPGKRLLVLGDVILDRYLEGNSTRLCREAPVPIVSVANRQQSPGGAANTATNARALGASVSILGIVGADQEGRILRRCLYQRGVDVRPLVVSRRLTTVCKTRVLSAGQLLCRFDSERYEAPDHAAEARLIAELRGLHPHVDALLIADYGYSAVTANVVDTLLSLQRIRRCPIFVDSRKRLGLFQPLRPDAVKPNYTEAVELLGSDIPRDGDRARAIADHAEELFSLSGARSIVVTLDADGALLLRRGEQPYRTYSRPVAESLANGAGDAFFAAYAVSLACDAPPPRAAELASAVAAVAVAKHRTAVCDAEELRNVLRPLGKLCLEPRALARRIESMRDSGKRIVFTNGCFDLLHSGHIGYLNRAKALGDVLIVGLNDDESITRLKGNGRPINALGDRIEVMASLSCVDHILPFSEDTAASLVQILRPDVLVKGAGYTEDTLPEAPLVRSYGGRVVFLSQDDQTVSTGSIIRHIRRACVPDEAPHPARAVGA